MRAIHSTSPVGNCAVGMLGIERDSSIVFGVLALKHLGHHLAGMRLDDDAVACDLWRCGCDDQHVAVAVERQHGIALHLQRIGAFGRLAPAVRPGPSPGRPESRHRRRSRRRRPARSRAAERRSAAPARPVAALARLPSTSAKNSSSEESVASMILASDSVEGQRGRPSADSRFDLLKAVESRPARLASPDADSE